MDKIVNGITYTKAKFLRTTCKTCGTTLTHGQITSEQKFCSKRCKTNHSTRVRGRGATTSINRDNIDYFNEILHPQDPDALGQE